MEQFSDKLLTNIPESGEYTVVLIMLHKERLQNILNNAINIYQYEQNQLEECKNKKSKYA